MNNILFVGGDASFSTLQAAIASIPADNTTPYVIKIAPGIYEEKVTIDRSHLTIEGTGEDPSAVVLTYADYAFDTMEDGSRRGTFRSYSVLLDASDVTLRNLTIENASGDSETHGQAIALYADGDRIMVDHCRLLSHQDTLFTGPLPPKELQPGGFIGPKQFAPRIPGRQYYRDCYICGDVDFIFGSATAYFEHCTIESLLRTKAGDTPQIQGYVSAPSTPREVSVGYVFFECRLTGTDCPHQSVYLGRPWREFGQRIFLSCEFGPHIHPDGFHDWNKTDAHDTFLFAEYDNHLSDGTPFFCKAAFTRHLDASSLHKYSRRQVLGGTDHWNPAP